MSEPDDLRISDLYGRTPRAAPTRASDRVILAAAHRAVGAGRPRRQLRGWALAASLVLGAGIGWQVLTLPPETGMTASPPAGEARQEATTTRRQAEPVQSVPVPGPPPVPTAALRADSDPAAGKSALRDEVPAAGESIVDERASRKSALPACSAWWLPDDRPREAWLAAIGKAHTAGESARAACLQARYDALFAD